MKQLDLNQTFILNPVLATGATTQQSIYTNNIISISGSTEINLRNDSIIINRTLIPVADNNSDLGTTVQRFRSLNTVSGFTSYWAATVLESQIINTPILNLGFDMYNYYRVLTADNSILSGDTLGGLVY